MSCVSDRPFCINYKKIYWEWRRSGGEQKWRYDGRCGELYPLPDGTPSECDPDGENPCCSDRWDGRCGNTEGYCSCYTCIDYKFVKQWEESGGARKWRDDGRCGTKYPLPDGSPSQCDPDGENPCCRNEYERCGNTYRYCFCENCTDYKLLNEWEKSGGVQKLRYDGRCGEDYPLPDGTPSECDPDGENYCCSAVGRCGNTVDHCTCFWCLDYKFLREWKESGGKKRWRRDGKCGYYWRLPDKTISECDPDGDAPCCSDWYNGECGSTSTHCSCRKCIDSRRVLEEYNVSGGKQRWRYDGGCGSWFPLLDGTPAECDPDGSKPCCSEAKGYGRCGSSSRSYCLCSDCVDFRLARVVREAGTSCVVTKLYTGYLKNVCFDEDKREQYFKCTHSDVSYKMEVGNDEYLNQDFEGRFRGVSVVCQDEQHFYQACGLGTQITNTDVLCGGYICEQAEENIYKYIECLGEECKVEKRDCIESSYEAVAALCDDKCDSVACKDESSCNGYQYGITCSRAYIQNYYVSVDDICDLSKHCEDGSDEEGCEVTEYTLNTCTRYAMSWKIAPILNYTRCSVIDGINRPYCKNYMDQTECSDKARVGGYCKVDGEMLSVSKYVVCLRKPADIKLCDDGMETNCLFPSSSTCEVHKHKICDELKDCPDGADETHDMCGVMTDFTCIRRFGPANPASPMPVTWLLDGEEDCMDGEDEIVTLWENYFCDGEAKQIKVPDKSCDNVYRCPDAEETFASFDQLCDGVESCGDGGENDVCKTARDFPTIDKEAPYRGEVRTVCNASNDEITREIREFTRPWGEVFGEPKIELFVPNFKVNCSQMFGEHYLFLSCMDLCKEEDARCPLDGKNRRLEYDSCPGQFLDRTYTLGGNSFLTFLDKTDSGRYHQDFFRCNNSRCVEYKQVCDLVDDCGDMSDELNCVNNMVCENTRNTTKKQFISLQQKCDGIYDCFDLSDECNETCMKYILGGWALKAFCWVMGFLALLFNLFTVVRGISSIKNCATEGAMTSKVLMSLIGSGDFMIGLYLVILSVYDSVVYGRDYCKNQAEWLTGTACLSLGVISTVGSQLSLFSMTVMSCIRIYGIQSMKIPGPIDKKAVMRVASLASAIIAASLAVAVIPLVPALENYFVQGMYYDPAYKVFIGFPNKDRHTEVLKTYYEETKRDGKTYIQQGDTGYPISDLSWEDIATLVDGMFTHDFGLQLTRSPVHFYGNDGVCLFKYFVRTDDARRSRNSEGTEAEMMSDPVVWSMLAINLFCFFIISVCYIAIIVKARQSLKNAGQHGNPTRLKAVAAVQSKVLIIIATDFLCWVPFIIISGLHSLKYINASTWYATFAMIVLPLNSVINPLIYDGALKNLIRKRWGEATGSVEQGASTAMSTISRPFRRENGGNSNKANTRVIWKHRIEPAIEDEEDTGNIRIEQKKKTNDDK